MFLGDLLFETPKKEPSHDIDFLDDLFSGATVRTRRALMLYLKKVFEEESASKMSLDLQIFAYNVAEKTSDAITFVKGLECLETSEVDEASAVVKNAMEVFDAISQQLKDAPEKDVAEVHLKSLKD